MASFTPYWDLKADTQYIQEGTDILIRLSINKEGTTGDSYTLSENEYLEMIFTIQCLDNVGNVFNAENHYSLFVGNDPNNLVPLSDGTTGNKFLNGRHKCRIQKNNFYLPSTIISEDVYYLKLHCKRDGTFNNVESVVFNLQAINVMHFGNISPSGLLRANKATVTFDSKEIWVTPGLTVTDDEQLYCIGDIEYGSDSTLFIQGFGRKRPYQPNVDSAVDTSPRVFFPAYRLLDITEQDLPSRHITGKAAYLRPDDLAFPVDGINKEVKVNIVDDTGKITKSGLSFNPNGQFLQTFLHESEPTDVYFKVEIVDILKTYITLAERFAIDQRFKAYQMWVCPNDVSTIAATDEKPKPNHLYQLRDNVVYPYVISGEYDEGMIKPLFKSSDWNDLGYYDVSLGSGIIGEKRMFRFLENAAEGSSIQIITDPDLGTIHVGEYFGHTVYPQILTNSKNQVSCVLVGGDDITKYGLDLTPDGYLVGTAYALSTDFSANDDIKLNFQVEVYDTEGSSVIGDFKLKIVRGLGQNHLSSHIVPSVQFEREWFKCISTQTFANYGFHRQSDDRYGLQKVPRILLKENFVSQNYNYTNLNDLKKVLRENIIDPSGATIPNGKFKMVIGNYKIMSALDNKGNLLYDLVFRELHPEGTQVAVSTNPRIYTNVDNGLLAELFGLRQNIYKAVGEDTTNLVKDPTDLVNRGLYVDAIPGISDEMIDTVPRFMNHPYIEDGIEKKFMPIIPVAYCLPGKGEAFFQMLLQNNEHSSMVSTEFEVTAVEFGYFAQEHERYVHDTFRIALQNDII